MAVAPTLLVLQHIACEPPAAFEDELLARGLSLERVELDEGETPPDWRGFDGLVVMGGPMGAYEDEAHPWLGGREAPDREAAQAGQPVWGVCLGAQLLAAALGARVYPGPGGAEVGMLPVELTDAAAADPVFAGAPRRFPTLQWHGDTFDLPDGATRLAGSPAYPNQAFVLQERLRAPVPPRGHAGAGREWGEVPAYAESAGGDARSGLPARPAGRCGAQRCRSHCRSRARLFGRWLEHVVGVPARAVG